MYNILLYKLILNYFKVGINRNHFNPIHRASVTSQDSKRLLRVVGLFR